MTSAVTTYQGVKLPYDPSHYQRAVIDWLLRAWSSRGQGFSMQAGPRALVVDACPGSGKTATLKMMCRYLRHDALALAFNKHIAEEMSSELTGSPVTVKTIHSVGAGCLFKAYRGAKLDASKYLKLARQIVTVAVDTGRVDRMTLNADDRDAVETAWPVKDLRDIVNMARLTLAKLDSESALLSMCGTFEIELDPKVPPRFYLTAARWMLSAGAAAMVSSYDYTDMIYQPSVNAKLRPYRYSTVFVDESQDLSAAQLELVLQCVQPNGTIVFVGDRRQAIYGFAGASPNSIEEIISRTGAAVLPLSICYRCPRSHVEMAAEIVPGIESAPWAVDGEVIDLTDDQVSKTVQQGDLIVCRKTSPLIKLCYQLLKDGISAKVRGRAIGEQLISYLEKAVGPVAIPWETVPDALARHRTQLVEQILRANGGDEDDPQIETVNDKHECLMVFYSACQRQTLTALVQTIEELFSDQRPSVWLSTVHRAKGLEADRVFILYPSLMPMRARQQWQQTQEENIEYIAVTRAKRTLYLVKKSAHSDGAG